MQRVLEFYGKHADLMELIREMQWPATEKGASMDALAKSLNSRRIHTAAVNVERSQVIVWDYPAIVQLAEDDHEHYVVWLPPNNSWGAPKIWDGPPSLGLLPERFNSRRTGPVLVTSEEPIPESAVVARQRSTDRRGFYHALFLIALACLGFVTGFVMPWKRADRSTPAPG